MISAPNEEKPRARVPNYEIPRYMDKIRFAELMERMSRWKSNKHEEKVRQAIWRLALIDIFIYKYIMELSDLREKLAKDPVLRQLTPIVDKMINHLRNLLRRWKEKKYKVIRVTREGLIKRKEKIEGNGFRIEANYYKGVIDLRIYLSGGDGDHVTVPDLGINGQVLRAIRMGWRASDAYHKDVKYRDKHYQYLRMTTTFTWQVLSWLISMPSAKVYLYAEGISVSSDSVKLIWHLETNGFNVEWFSDMDAYQEMVKLPRELFLISLTHAIMGDGHSEANNGYRLIYLSNDDHNVLELVKARLENEFKVRGSIILDEHKWVYKITGEDAQRLTGEIINAMGKMAPQIKALYDLMAGGEYELVWFEKWTMMIRAAIYIYGQFKVQFMGYLWSPHFSSTAIRLKIKKNAKEIRRSLEAQGIEVAGDDHEARIEWSVLKQFLCDKQLREQLLNSARKAVEHCRLMNMTSKKKKNCDKIPANKWIKRLQDEQWLKSIGCADPAQRSPGPKDRTGIAQYPAS